MDGIKLVRQGKIKGQKLIYNTADRKAVVGSVPKSEVAMDTSSLAPTASVVA